MLSGSNPFNNIPKQTIENVSLTVAPSIKYLGAVLSIVNVAPSIKYLGAVLSGVNGDIHTTECKCAAHKAFFHSKVLG